VVVAGDVGDAAEAALEEALEEAAPMHLGFAESDADAQESAFAVGPDAQGEQDGAIEQLAVLADLFVAGIEDEIGKGAEGAIAPLLEFGVEEFGAGADLGGADAGAAEFLDNGGDFAGGDALDIAAFCAIPLSKWPVFICPSLAGSDRPLTVIFT
jgi:hypothetical protein